MVRRGYAYDVAKEIKPLLIRSYDAIQMLHGELFEVRPELPAQESVFSRFSKMRAFFDAVIGCISD